MIELKEREGAEALAPAPELYRRVFARPRLVSFLKIFDRAAVLIVALGYLAALVWCAFGHYKELIRLAVSTAIPFVAISLFRLAFNAPRPYELYDLTGLVDTSGSKRGRSFPSRHVASAFLIGSSLCFINPIAGAIALVLGAGLGACRVLLAKHFVRDVITGALLGGILGCLGMLIVNIS